MTMYDVKTMQRLCRKSGLADLVLSHDQSVPPDLCCFKFFDKRIPKVHILSIRKTHSKCLTEAFV
uniref:Chemokine interleukin-8-like domain-containing protein n=1 Tax=Neolamprologus brichardi TaxID=32507 RepID=A0A3Q4GA00_NEOBR